MPAPTPPPKSSSAANTLARATAIIESAPIAMVLIDSEGSIVLVNTETEKLFGYSRQELLEQKVELLVPERYRSEHPKLRTQFFMSPVARRMGAGRDLFGLRKNGSEFPVEIGLNPIRTEEGLFVLSVIVDITERKRMEARFRATVESAPTAMVMIDTAGSIVLVNAETEKLFGYGRQELLGQRVEALVPERFRGEHPKLRTRFFTAPQARRMGEGRDLFGLRKDGTEFPVEIGLNPIETDEGFFVLSAIVDITERKRAQEEIQRLNMELEERVLNRTALLEAANKELEAFSYSVSHDLRAPLRHIGGYVELLKKKNSAELSEKGVRYLSSINESVMRMEQLIEDLLAFSRIGRIEMRRTRVDPGPMIEEILGSTTEERAGRSIDIRFGPLPAIQGDPSLMRIVFSNLISNAIKYTRQREKAEIEIGCQADDGRLIFFVKDNGAGFDMKYKGKLFGVFQRLHTADEFEGTGIGLANVRRIVLRHGGETWAEGEVGKGATFYFSVPKG